MAVSIVPFSPLLLPFSAFHYSQLELAKVELIIGSLATKKPDRIFIPSGHAH